MKTEQFNLRVDSEVLNRLEVAADSSHMSRNQFAAVVLGVVSEIEPKLALAALGDLKAKYGRRAGPGRPPSGPRFPDGDAKQAA